MTVLSLDGLRADGLQTCLAAYGLIRLVHEQADPDARSWWTGGHLVLDTTVDDLPGFLLEQYRPMPVFSPWNGGSGFGAKDRNQRAVIDAILDTGGERFAAMRATFTATQRVLDRAAAAETMKRPWDKARLARELHNVVPEDALPWLDAVLVDGGERLFYPAVFGTGGNDGRLEFSSNFHQRLADVLPELGAKAVRSRELAGHALFGETGVPMLAKPAGQFDAQGGASAGTYATGSGTSLVNPWLYVLSIEASGLLQAAATRSAGQSRPGASMPFQVRASSMGATAGSDTEDVRGEFWAPTWSRPLHGREVRQLFAESRASWAGGTAVSAHQMYGAAHARGVDERLTAFYRYALVKRNGLAFIGALRDTVHVTGRPDVASVIPIDERIRAFDRGSSGRARDQARGIRRLRDEFLAAEDPFVAQPILVDLLAALTRREADAARSDREREAITGAAPRPKAREVLGRLGGWLESRPEHRLAACLASARIAVDPGSAGTPDVSMAQLLIGEAPRQGRGWVRPRIPGYGARPLDEVLADVVVWRDQHVAPGTEGAGRGLRITAGHGYRCPMDDVYAWVAGDLDETRLARAFEACLALDWVGARFAEVGTQARRTPPMGYAVCAAVASGAIVLPGHVATEADEDGRQGWPRGWALRLRAGRVAETARDAVALLNRSRIAPHALHPGFDSAPVQVSSRTHPDRRVSVSVPHAPTLDRRLGVRLTAALVAPAGLLGLEAAKAVHVVGDQPDEGTPTPPSHASHPSVFVQIDEGVLS